MSDDEKPPPEITPQVVHLFELLKWAREGRLRIPMFQRPYVWKRKDILDFIDSIGRRYPVGTLFMWQSARPIHVGDRIGPLVLPAQQGQPQFVLDGQQRLTTLVGVLLRTDPRHQPAGDDDDPGRWTVHYDAKERAFVHLDPDIPALPHQVPAPALMETLPLFKAVTALMTSGDPDAESYVNQVQEVSRAIQSYRIPIVVFATDELSVAVGGFSRLNRKGRSVSQDEMFSALTYTTDGFHLAREIDKLQADMLKSDFGRVDRAILLRAVLVAANLDPYRTDWDRLSTNTQAALMEQFPRAVEEARSGLDRARGFLRTRLQVWNVRMLPYASQLVALAAFFGRCAAPTEAQLTTLERWFWASAFSGWFGGGNPSQVRDLLEAMRDTLPGMLQPDRVPGFELRRATLPTPSRFDLRSARVRTLLCVLFRRSPQTAEGAPVTAEQAGRVLHERGPEAMRTICARSNSADLRRTPANRILDVGPPGARGQARGWVLGLAEPHLGTVLDSHAIPSDALALLRARDHDGFLQRRMELFVEIEQAFMREMGVVPPADPTPRASPLDAEDDIDEPDYDTEDDEA